jgi:hypothetical protein
VGAFDNIQQQFDVNLLKCCTGFSDLAPMARRNSPMIGGASMKPETAPDVIKTPLTADLNRASRESSSWSKPKAWVLVVVVASRMRAGGAVDEGFRLPRFNWTDV